MDVDGEVEGEGNIDDLFDGDDEEDEEDGPMPSTSGPVEADSTENPPAAPPSQSATQGPVMIELG
jgi:hypothetical protein